MPPVATRGCFLKEKMVMHMVVVTLSLRVFKKIDFFTFHSKVFHKLLLTQNYLFFLLLTQNFLSLLQFILTTFFTYNFSPLLFSVSANFSLYASF
ncbi:hypothetical protein HanHA300_Chr02g0040891 [Helianthus annuus]|nr:hypothetical protein HanHA300_Chr02g0040891 [Helianthus annuus]KAJ0617644.1 hypothetical protein HanHA89_Chr02g0044111 [Helianthus annuus]KAJ0776183.1 hypothetical protein HanLR1_Chr02g0042671 [Helianthus annuus]